MNVDEVLRKFSLALQTRKYEKAKALVSNNIKCITHERHQVNFMWMACRLSATDCPDLVTHLVSLDAPLLLKVQGGHTCLSIAAILGKHRMVRKLLDFGVDPDTISGNDRTTLDEMINRDRTKPGLQRCVMHVIDAGAKKFDRTENWVLKLRDHRLGMRTCVITLLGLQRCGSSVLGHNGRDVLRLIGRVVWSNRFNFLE